MDPAAEADSIAACAGYRALYPRLYAVALAIQKHEGYFPTSRAFRNNNPGNLRRSPLATSVDDQPGGPLCVFPDYHTGLRALLRDLWGKCTGHSSTGLHGGSTLGALVKVWAPPSENDTRAYVAAVTAATGLPPSTSLLELLKPGDLSA